MIFELRNKEPLIDFGFGAIEKTVSVNTPVTIWQNTIYNSKEYEYLLTYTDSVKATQTKVSDYEYQLSYNEPGVYSITIIVSNKAKSIGLTSNTITLNVI